MADTMLEKRDPSKRIGALRGLLPFMRPYRGMIALASAALVVT
jgi:ATP-binding cassette subfamily B protein